MPSIPSTSNNPTPENYKVDYKKFVSQFSGMAIADFLTGDEGSYISWTVGCSLFSFRTRTSPLPPIPPFQTLLFRLSLDMPETISLITWFQIYKTENLVRSPHLCKLCLNPDRPFYTVTYNPTIKDAECFQKYLSLNRLSATCPTRKEDCILDIVKYPRLLPGMPVPKFSGWENSFRDSELDGVTELSLAKMRAKYNGNPDSFDEEDESPEESNTF